MPNRHGGTKPAPQSFWSPVVIFLSLLILFMIIGPNAFANFPRVDQAFARFDLEAQAIIARTPQGEIRHNDIAWLQEKLARMVEYDQAVRKFWSTPAIAKYNSDESAYFIREVQRRYPVDQIHTEIMKEILGQCDWFLISKFGSQADDHAWLLVQHADQDRAYQRMVLERLERLAPLGETRPRHVAYLYDRVSTPQRYGTQGRCVAPGRWEPFEIEDYQRVDELRASVGLNSLAEYAASISSVCL